MRRDRTAMRAAGWLAVAAFLAGVCGCAAGGGRDQASTRSAFAAEAPSEGTPVVEAISLLGEPLERPQAPEGRRRQMERDLAEARERLAESPNSEEAAIWVGRRLAYLGRYNEAVEVYTRALGRHPESYRLRRHRGHRFITLRRFGEAVEDLSEAAELARGVPDRVEPDGMPNAINMPRSSDQTNIWYHLALAHYLRGEFAQASAAWRTCLDYSGNDDMLCAASNWLYLSLRRQGKDDDAAEVLLAIRPTMDVIENQDYHRLLQCYRGELRPEEVLGTAQGELGSATVLHGLGALALCDRRGREARERFERAVEQGPWAAFGAIAAEAELARLARIEVSEAAGKDER